MKVTEKCDVYSFGVVAIEILMGRHPGQLLSELAAVRNSLEGSLEESLLDQRLGPPTKRVAKVSVSMVAKIALVCLHEKPEQRPSMVQVCKMLQ